MEKFIVCAICRKEVLRKDTDRWCYHTSFPGPVCRHHYGVMEEYDSLIKKASKELEDEMA